MRVYRSVFICTLIILLTPTLYGSGTYRLCYECLRVPYPQDCDRIVRCERNNTVCFVEEVVSHNGVVLFNLGCRQDTRCYGKTRTRNVLGRHLVEQDDIRQNNEIGSNSMTLSDVRDDVSVDMEDSDLVVCEECCSGDFCNSHGCNAKPLPPIDQRGPVCFNCHQQSGEDMCDQLTVCDLGQSCYLAPVHTGTNAIIFTTGCVESMTCVRTPEIAIGKREYTTCTGCCTDDYCNRNCSTISYHLNPVSIFPPLLTSTKFGSPLTSTSTVQSTVASTSGPTTTTTTTIPTTTTTTTIPATTTTTTIPATTTTVPHIATINRKVCQLFQYTYSDQFHKCYKVYNDKYRDMLPWQEARDKCKQDGGDLIIFENKDEETFFASLEEKLNHLDLPRFWIGATNLNEDHVWEWLDGRPVNESYFHPGEPNDSHNQGEHCAALAQFIIHGRIAMNDDICTVHTNFICEISTRALQSSLPTQNSLSHCRNHDYKYLEAFGMCYKIYNDVKKSQSEARSTCQQQHGDLLVLRNSTVEQVFQEMHFYDHNEMLRYWIGAKRIPGHMENRFESFRWLNGRNLESGLQWFTGEPNNYNNEEDCVTFTYFNNKDIEFALNDDHCSTQYYFICEEKCPDKSYQYFPHFDLCIKIYNERVTWSEARARCSQDKTDLVEPDNLKAMQFLEFYLNITGNSDGARYWVGARDDAKHSHYEWLTSSKVVPDELWHHGEPNWSHGNEHCAALHYFSQDDRLLMNDLDCKSAIGFICQHIW